MSELELESLIRRIVKRILSNRYLTESYDDKAVLGIISEEIENHEISVTHVENSFEKYGNGNEYNGFDSWIDFCEKRSTDGKRISAISKCPCCGEPMIHPDGAHVQDSSGNIYVTPVCSKCNGTAAQDVNFRKRQFQVKYKHLVPFNYDELKKLRHSK